MYWGPTWLRIPRSDRRIHSFVTKLETPSHYLQFSPEFSQRNIIAGQTSCNSLRTGDLIFLQGETSTLLYYVDDFLQDETGKFQVRIRHFWNWIQGHTSSEELDWWKEFIQFAHQTLHTFKRAKLGSQTVESRIWYPLPTRRDTVKFPTNLVGVSRPQESSTNLFYGGVLYPDGRPYKALTDFESEDWGSWETSMNEAWEKVFQILLSLPDEPHWWDPLCAKNSG